MSTEWNWSWVATPNDTLKSSDSFDDSGGTVYTYRAANRGQLSASDISTSIDSLSTNINQQWRLWRIYIRPLLDSLPAGQRDQRWRPGTGLPYKIDALTYGIQGTTLFVFNDATSTNAYGKYWHSTDERPKTIAEALEDLWDAVADLTPSTTASSSSDGNTLVQAYNQGGAGLGRVITANDGAVEIQVSDTGNNACLDLTQSDITNDPNVLEISNAGSGDSISLQGTGTHSINSVSANLELITTTSGNITATTPNAEMQLINTDAVIDSDKAFYFGDSSTNGSWRIVRSGNNLIMERRETGSWVTKQTITP